MQTERERGVEGKCGIESLAEVMRGRNVSMEVKRSLWNSILQLTLTWTWNRAHHGKKSNSGTVNSRVHQGSVLGPLLFIIYVDYLVSEIFFSSS